MTATFEHLAKITITPTHISLDIQGNFHRGLMLGALAGFFLGLGICVAASLLILAVLR